MAVVAVVDEEVVTTPTEICEDAPDWHLLGNLETDLRLDLRLDFLLWPFHWTLCTDGNVTSRRNCNDLVILDRLITNRYFSAGILNAPALLFGDSHTHETGMMTSQVYTKYGAIFDSFYFNSS